MAKQIFTPVTDDAKTVAPSSREDVSNFLKKAKALALGTDGRGGLIFALDATMSRQATWDQAQHIQAEMFSVVGQAGALDIQLVYFRGFGECRASRWVGEPSKLRKLMGGIDCRGGRTQIAKVLSHARKETSRKNPLNPNRSRVDALVFVGDAMEENPDTLCARAGELGLLGIPCFMFQEGRDISNRANFSRNRPADKRCIHAFWPRFCRPPFGFAEGGCQLCRRRQTGAGSKFQQGCKTIAGSDEMSISMIALLVALIALAIFVSTPAARLAGFIKVGLPIGLIIAGIGLTLLRHAGVGSILLFTGIALWRRLRGTRSFGPNTTSARGRSGVRSAALEMELDHDTGAMNGIVLVGTLEGRELDQLSRQELLVLRDEIMDDSESLALLDAYLDRRLAGWRKDAEPDSGAGQGTTPGSGSMSEQEAYEVLGLSAGVSATQIRQAHRRLMKTAHPDSGGSTFLAAKINEAKDVLLRSHS